MADLAIPGVKIVGYEGLLGALGTLGIMMPIAYYLPGGARGKGGRGRRGEVGGSAVQGKKGWPPWWSELRRLIMTIAYRTCRVGKGVRGKGRGQCRTGTQWAHGGL